VAASLQARIARAFRFTPYGTHASQLIDSGVDIVAIAKRLAHRKADITLRVHAHLFRKNDGKAAAAISPALGLYNRPVPFRRQFPILFSLGQKEAIELAEWKGGRVV
jgi:hypothetical protein